MTGALILSGCLLLWAQDDQSVIKQKQDVVVIKDKSKPVRRALEIQYAKLAEAVENRDFEAFQALRTADFHTIDEQGNPRTPQQMAERARAMLQRIQPPIKTHNEILLIEVKGEKATATVRQYFSKMLPVDGRLRRVETYVTQDETWTNTPDGWKLSFVGNVRDGETYIDGERFEPTSQPATTRASTQPALDAARQELEAVFAERIRGTREKDADTLVAMISPDYVALLPDGRRVGYEEIIAYLRRGTEQFIEVKEMTITIEKLELRGVDGDEAVVDARQRVARTQRLADGQVHEVFTTVLQAETWVRTPDGWKLRLVTDLREQEFLVDGQPAQR